MELTQEQINELKSLNRIHVSWRDYALMLVNSTGNNGGLRDIWHEKINTSYEHWMFKSGSISEGNVAGLEILSELPDEFTQSLVDDSYGPDGPFSWYKLDRLAGSKRINVHVGNYPQESLSNEANLCVKYLLEHWDDIVLEHVDDENGEYVNGMTGEEIWGISTTLKKIWNLAQMSGGQCVLPDEVLTYLLERPVDDKLHCSFVQVCFDVFTNGIPSDLYGKYWRSEKIEGFPLNCSSDLNKNLNTLLNTIDWDPSSENFDMNARNGIINGVLNGYKCELPLDEQKENVRKFCDVMLKEDVAMSPCWKKIAICVLKNDVSFKYAGFGATWRERQAREEAIAAFSTKQDEKEKAKANAMAMAKKIEEERKKDNNF